MTTVEDNVLCKIEYNKEQQELVDYDGCKVEEQLLLLALTKLKRMNILCKYQEHP